MSGNPVFRGTRVPVHMLAELVPSRACALPEGKCDTLPLWAGIGLFNTASGPSSGAATERAQLIIATRLRADDIAFFCWNRR